MSFIAWNLISVSPISSVMLRVRWRWREVGGEGDVEDGESGEGVVCVSGVERTWGMGR